MSGAADNPEAGPLMGGAQAQPGAGPQRRPWKLAALAGAAAVMVAGAVGLVVLAGRGAFGLRGSAAPAEVLPPKLILFSEAEVLMPKLIPVSDDLKDFPPLCDDDIVAETCTLLNSKTPEFFGTMADKNESIMHASELAFSAASDRDSVVDFLQALGAKNAETNGHALDKGAFAVVCKELCLRTLASFDDDMLPEASDVGCYVNPATGNKACDLDVSQKSLSALSTEKEPEHEVLKPGNHLHRYPITGNLSRLDAMSYPETRAAEMRMIVARLFRIYPLVAVTVEMNESAAARRRLSGGSRNDDSCKYAKDGECDNTNGWCTHGTDCTDCNDCNKNDDSCKWAKDEECDGEEFCNPGTDCTDCGNCDGSPSHPPEPPPPDSHSEIVVKSVQELTKAAAWGSNAMRKVGARQCSGLLTKWFGSAGVSVRREFQTVARSAIATLTNCEIRTDEHECQKSPVLAFVYPGQANSQGKQIIFMCASSLQYNPLAGVLFHEAAHHPPANRDDVIYGRSQCEELAKQNPRGALNNADSVEYFVSDVNQR